MMSAYWKIPLQALVLLTGVLVFVFYLFNQPPMLFNRAHAERVEKSGRGAEFQQLESRFSQAFENRRSAASVLAAANSDEQRAAAREAFVTANSALKGVRGEAAAIVRDVAGDESYGRLMGDTPVPDVNYVFPTFVTTRLPIGLVGLIIAAIFAAAMSSIAAELNSLATSTVIDMYRRHFRPSESDQHYLRVSKGGDALLGHLRLHRRHLRRRPRLADRGRESVRIFLLWIAARCVRPGARFPPLQRSWRIRQALPSASPSSPSSHPIPPRREFRFSGTIRSALSRW